MYNVIKVGKKKRSRAMKHTCYCIYSPYNATHLAHCFSSFLTLPKNSFLDWTKNLSIFFDTLVMVFHRIGLLYVFF